MSLRTRARSAALLAFLSAAVGVLACTEVGTDPAVPIAIELDAPLLPSVVVGDTMRDSTGAAVALAARAFNSRNELIPGARITFVARDTTGIVAVDSLTGFVVGLRLGDASVFANAGNLPSAPVVVHVVPRPDSVVALSDSVDTLLYRQGVASQSKLMRIAVRADTTPADLTDSLIPVPNYLVRYRVVSPAELADNQSDTTRLILVNDLGRPSSADTTDAQGAADRRLRFSSAVPAAGLPDSVVVEATVVRPDVTAVPGSPVRFVIRLRAAP